MKQLIALATQRLKSSSVHLVHAEKMFHAVLADVGLSPTMPLSHYIDELLSDEPLSRSFSDHNAIMGYTKYISWADRVKRRDGNVVIYYALPRELKPSCIVETGTADGAMTSFLAAAVARNRTGKLISIDIPPAITQDGTGNIFTRDMIGGYIPHSYRTSWEYREGDAKELLPHVMKEAEVGFFIHDSLHTADHMTFEYECARAHMQSGTLIASDDISLNSAFADFTRRNSLPAYSPKSNSNLGICINRQRSS